MSSPESFLLKSLGYGSREAIQAALARQGITAPAPAVPPPARVAKLPYDATRARRPYHGKVKLLPQIVALRRQNKTTKEIGAALGCSHSHVAKMLRQHFGSARLRRVARRPAPNTVDA